MATTLYLTIEYFIAMKAIRKNIVAKKNYGDETHTFVYRRIDKFTEVTL